MFGIYSQSNDESAYKTDFICSSVDDIATLPKNVDPGSTALVPVGNKLTVYILGMNKEWMGPY